MTVILGKRHKAYIGWYTELTLNISSFTFMSFVVFNLFIYSIAKHAVCVDCLWKANWKRLKETLNVNR